MGAKTSDNQTSDIRLSHFRDWLFASHGDRDIRRSDVRYQTVTALWLVFVSHRDGAVAAAGRIYKNVAKRHRFRLMSDRLMSDVLLGKVAQCKAGLLD